MASLNPSNVPNYVELLAARPGGEVIENELDKEHQDDPGAIPLKDMPKAQESTDLIIHKVPFSRLVREITQDYAKDIHFQVSALGALHEVTEAFMIGFFEDCNLKAIMDKRVTVQVQDVKAVQRDYQQL